jgi:hypothetical protein
VFSLQVDTPIDAWIVYYKREMVAAVQRMNEALEQGDMKQHAFQEKVADRLKAKLDEYMVKKAEWLLRFDRIE